MLESHPCAAQRSALQARSPARREEEDEEEEEEEEGWTLTLLLFLSQHLSNKTVRPFLVPVFNPFCARAPPVILRTRQAREVRLAEEKRRQQRSEGVKEE